MSRLFLFRVIVAASGLFVPVDKRLEKRPLEYVRSKSAQRRGEGVRALAYFKTEKNIELVRSLLDDPEVTYVQPAYENKPEQRV